MTQKPAAISRPAPSSLSPPCPPTPEAHAAVVGARGATADGAWGTCGKAPGGAPGRVRCAMQSAGDALADVNPRQAGGCGKALGQRAPPGHHLASARQPPTEPMHARGRSGRKRTRPSKSRLCHGSGARRVGPARPRRRRIRRTCERQRFAIRAREPVHKRCGGHCHSLKAAGTAREWPSCGAALAARNAPTIRRTCGPQAVAAPGNVIGAAL